MSTKFFPLNLSKFKRVSSDKETTTLRHEQGHEVKIAHNALTPKLRGHLAALPEHKERNSKESNSLKKMADGGTATPAPSPSPEESYKKKASDFEKGVNSPGWNPSGWAKNLKEGLGMADGGEIPNKEAPAEDMTPKSMMVKNPAYTEGSNLPEYMPKSILEDDKPLEQPIVDPVSLGLSVATGGASAIGPVALNAVKNKVGSAALGVADRMFPVKPVQTSPQPITQVGNNSMYKTGSPVSNYRSDLIKSMPPQVKKYAEGTPDEPVQAQDPMDMTALAQQQEMPQSQDPTGMTVPQPPVPTQPQTTPGISPQGQVVPPRMEGGLPDLNPGDIYSQGNQAIQQQQAGEQQQGEARSKAATQYQNEIAKQQTYFNNAQAAKLQEINKLVDEHNADKIKPNNYMENMDTPGRVSTAIGLILGGMGSGMLHQENPALKFLNAQIDRDIMSQKANMDKRATVIGSYMDEYKNGMVAENMARASQLAMYGAKLDKAAADAQNPLAQARALQASAALKQQIYPLVYQANVFHAANQGGGSGAEGKGGVPADYTKGEIPQYNKGSPAAHVNGMITDREARNKAMAEVERATNTRKMAASILSNFDKAAKDNTIARTGAGLLRTPASVLALHQAMQPTFGDLEGTVRQAAMDNTFHNITPRPGDRDSDTIPQKRQSLVDYLQSKKSAPFSEGAGVDLEKFAETTSDPRARFTPQQIKLYNSAIRNPGTPQSESILRKLGLKQ